MRAVADDTRDCVRQMMQVQHDIADPFAAQPVEDVLDQGAVAERNSGLGNESCEGIEPGAESGSQNESGQHRPNCSRRGKKVAGPRWPGHA